MRTFFVAGNWKMNKTGQDALQLVSDLIDELKGCPKIELAVCPPYPYLSQLAAALKGSNIGLGAQNMYWEAAGAYTGEVAPAMVAEFCQYVILGHSERRTLFGETDESVNRKVKAALAAGLTPIICVGETLAENEAGQTAAVVTRQLKGGLEGLNAEDGRRIVIAYEPVWAIGTGRAATSDQAQAVHRDVVRRTLAALFDRDTADAIRIQYGGSVNAKNAAELFSMPDIDGALVGGASLKAPDFGVIARAANAAR